MVDAINLENLSWNSKNYFWPCLDFFCKRFHDQFSLIFIQIHCFSTITFVLKSKSIQAFSCKIIWTLKRNIIIKCSKMSKPFWKTFVVNEIRFWDWTRWKSFACKLNRQSNNHSNPTKDILGSFILTIRNQTILVWSTVANAIPNDFGSRQKSPITTTTHSKYSSKIA